MTRRSEECQAVFLEAARMRAASRNTAWHSQTGSVIIPLMLVGTAILILVASLGSSALSVLRAQQMKTARGGMDEVIENFRQCIFDGESWSRTINDPTNSVLQCLLPGSPGCENGANGPIRLLQIRGGQFCIANYDSRNSTNGFNVTGQVCDGFAESGNPLCPYHVDLKWSADCPPPTPTAPPPAVCLNPTETVVMSIQFHPGPASKATRLNITDGVMRTGYSAKQTIAVTRIAPNRIVAQANYQSSGTTNLKVMTAPVETNIGRMPLVLIEKASAGIPAGPCQALGYVRRKISLIQADPGLRVNNLDLPTGIVTLRAGKYDCSISAPAYEVGSFFVYLHNMDTGEILVQGNSAFSAGALGFAQTRSVGASRFTLAADQKVELVQYCSDSPSPLGLNQLSLGLPMGMGDEYYSYINCRTYDVN